MKFTNLILPCFCLNYLLVVLIGIAEGPSQTVAQSQPSFELPVQLVGFPVIILSVRLANFAKKLAYSLNPRTYMGRTRREASDYYGEVSESAINLAIAERQILTELGPKACVIEEPCRIHATRKAKRGAQPDWSDILSNYKVQSNGMKQWYLLSVFIGDEVRDPALCKQLSKRLACDRNIKVPIRD
ncbi:hypothetical protein ACKWTF_007694 [Chironomus riparius]